MIKNQIIKTTIQININKLFYNYKFYKIHKIYQAYHFSPKSSIEIFRFLKEQHSFLRDFPIFHQLRRLCLFRLTNNLVIYLHWPGFFSIHFFLFFFFFFHLCFHLDGAILVSRGNRHQRHQVRHEDQVICNLSIRCPEPRSFHRGVDSWVTFPCQPVASFCSWNSLVY